MFIKRTNQGEGGAGGVIATLSGSGDGGVIWIKIQQEAIVGEGVFGVRTDGRTDGQTNRQTNLT